MTGDERVTAGLSIRDYDERYLFLVTRQGVVKRTKLSDLDTTRKAGIRALMLNEGDELVSSFITSGDDTVILCSRKGRAVRFHEDTVRCMGRTAVGVIGMKLEDGDEIISAAATPEGSVVLTVTEKGYGKKTPIEEFTLHGRGGKGMILHDITEKTGEIAGVIIPQEKEEDILIISSSGIIIRTEIADIRTCGRSSQGVILMRAQENEKIISVAAAEREAEEENPVDEAPVEE